MKKLFLSLLGILLLLILFILFKTVTFKADQSEITQVTPATVTEDALLRLQKAINSKPSPMNIPESLIPRSLTDFTGFLHPLIH